MDAIKELEELALSCPDMAGSRSSEILEAVRSGCGILRRSAPSARLLGDEGILLERRALACLERLASILRFRSRTDPSALALSLSARSTLGAVRAGLGVR